MTGRWIVVASWVGNGVFAAAVVPAAAGIDSLEGVAISVSLALFFTSLLVWSWVFMMAVARSAQGDDIVVANLFGTMGDAPRELRWHLFGALAVSVVIAAATAFANPFGVLVPMLPLGFVGSWAARHGTFPERRDLGRGRGRGRG